MKAAAKSFSGDSRLEKRAEEDLGWSLGLLGGDALT